MLTTTLTERLGDGKQPAQMAEHRILLKETDYLQI